MTSLTSTAHLVCSSASGRASGLGSPTSPQSPDKEGDVSAQGPGGDTEAQRGKATHPVSWIWAAAMGVSPGQHTEERPRAQARALSVPRHGARYAHRRERAEHTGPLRPPPGGASPLQLDHTCSERPGHSKYQLSVARGPAGWGRAGSSLCS